MTLKEKFTTMALDRDIADWEKACEKIADEFAIGFAIWKENNALQDINGNYYAESRIGVSRNNPINIYELLEIYKKEKEL